MSMTDIVFRIFPRGPVSEPDAELIVSDRLWNEHELEAERLGAEFYNYGWYQSETDACSKTSKGYLSSTIDPATMQVTHQWKP
jgi:hypothetical protein